MSLRSLPDAFGKLRVPLCEIGIVAGVEQQLGKLALRPRHPKG